MRTSTSLSKSSVALILHTAGGGGGGASIPMKFIFILGEETVCIYHMCNYKLNNFSVRF